MGTKTNIQWTDVSWNIARGCTKVDADCKFCYMYRDSYDNAVRLNCVKLHYIALSKDGIPMHPLYLKSDLTLTRFEWSFIKKELGIK